MSTLKETIKKVIPAPLWGALRAGRDSLSVAGQWPAATFHPWRRDTVQRLPHLKDIHKGERCFILGNGPSLRQTNLQCLKNEYTFGLNRIFMAFPEMGYSTSYYVSINDLMVEQSVDEIQKLTMPRFVSWRARKWMKPQDNLYFLHTTYTGSRFAQDLRGRVWEGATVTNVALQIAYYLGFKQVILIGVDHTFATKGKPNTTVVQNGDDPNHFNASYFTKGFRWQLPDFETSEIGYHLARQAFEADGRQVVDATVGGMLRVFPRVEYDSLF
jgi:hypothetical protein